MGMLQCFERPILPHSEIADQRTTRRDEAERGANGRGW